MGGEGGATFELTTELKNKVPTNLNPSTLARPKHPKAQFSVSNDSFCFSRLEETKKEA